jgi:K+-sensing histidine kinase KdpD
MDGDPFVIKEPARLLVADDDPILREFALAHLSGPTVEVVTAADGQEAVEHISQGGFDLCLLDLDMPRLDGFSVIERVRQDEATRHLPIVVITGREDILAIDRAYAAGATSFVVKPINWRLISHQLLYVLRNSRSEANLRRSRALAERADALKSNMLRLMSHELRTPFNVIVGYARELRRVLSDPAQRRQAEEIISSGLALLDTLSGLQADALALAGDVKTVMDEHAARDILRAGAAAAAMRDTEAPRKLKLIDRTDSDVLTLDKKVVTRILRVLIENALIHGAAPVVVTADRARHDGVVFTVRDHGPGLTGISCADFAAAFRQGDDALTRRVQGFGLGLAIAHRLAAAHGGCLTCANHPEGGFLASLELPGARAPALIRA